MNLKKAIKLLSTAIILALIITGCTSPEEEDSPNPSHEDSHHGDQDHVDEADSSGDNLLIPIEAAIFTHPENISTHTTSQLLVQVTQGEELVDDADEVIFEFWRYGDEVHQIMEATLQGEGIYAIEYTFEEDGIYYVVPHVTARYMHVMPYKRFIVGDVTEEEIREHEEELEELQQSQHMH